jgi:hypothetical protein
MHYSKTIMIVIIMIIVTIIAVINTSVAIIAIKICYFIFKIYLSAQHIPVHSMLSGRMIEIVS